MAKARKVAKSLADEIVEEPFERSGTKPWVTYLPAQTRKDVEEVRRQLRAREGKYQYASALAVAERLKRKLKLYASKHTIRRWLTEE